MSHQISAAGASKSKTLPTDEKLHVLIVDDASGIRMIHNMLVKSFGSHVQTQMAENGKVAVDLCRSGEHFDVILMDNHMPVMDGIQVTINQVFRILHGTVYYDIHVSYLFEKASF